MENILKQILEKLDMLQSDVAELKTDVTELKTDVTELKTDVAELKTTTDRIETKLDDLEVKNAENHVEVLKEIKAIRSDIITIEAVTGKNMQDIAHLKAVK
jgi:outer membrane murein-binding lipoprotein Lpp